MPLGVTPYRQNGFAGGLEGLAAILQGMGALKQGLNQRALNQRTVGDVLGYQSQSGAPVLNTMLTPPDTRPKYAQQVLGPQVPIGSMGRPSFVGAPATMQPLLGSTVRDFGQLGHTIGDSNLHALMSMIKPKSSFDENSLFYDPSSKQFDLVPSPGAIKTSPRQASIVQGQTRIKEDVKNKERLAAWRGGVEARMRRGGVSKEILAGLKNDMDLLDLRLNEGFEDMDPTEQTFINSQVGAALSRLQRYGVNPTKEVTRKTSDVYSKGGARTVADPKQARFDSLKKEFPDMSDDEIMALMAMEDTGAQ